MQVKDGFVLRKVGKGHIVVPAGDVSKDFNGMLRMNDVGAFLFQHLMQGITLEALVQAVCGEYDATPDQAKRDIDAFVKKLSDADLMK